jgi:ubiquinone/menaquinone biosynthesis C-methylase UbiE
MSTVSNEYLLGHEPSEMERLIAQAEQFRELTQDFLVRAGLEPGMRVLDVGCGPGDVSMLASAIVGPTGQVTGVDRSVDAVAVARRRAAAAGLSQCRFAAGDVSAWTNRVPGALQDLEAPFDAVIGRLVLMYLPEPAAALRGLARRLRPGGIVAFQEICMRRLEGGPHGALAEWCVQRIQDAFAYAGLDLTFGFKLQHLFRDVGLTGTRARVEAHVELGDDSATWAQLANVIRTLLPAIEQSGSATRSEVDVATLEQRLRAEAARTSPAVVGPALVGAWARVPESGPC